MAATATTMAIAFSVSWYALFWLVAPALADLAGSPDATPLVRLLTLTIVLDGITAVSVGVIQRRFQQDALMKAIAVGFVFNAIVSVTLALNGAGAYCFVVGALVQSLVVGVLVLRIARMPFRLGFDRTVARRLIAFGAPLALGLGIESVLLFSDSMIVGNVLGTVALGFYLLAFNISSWVPGLVGTAVRYVSIPAFSRLAEGEKEEMALGVQRSLPLMIGVVAPVATVMAVLAPAMIHVLYGAEWAPAAQALRFLAFVMVARMLTALVFDVQTGLGNTRYGLAEPRMARGPAPALWVGANAGGMRGAAGAHAVVAVVVAIPLSGWMLHRSGIDMRPVLRRAVRPSSPRWSPVRRWPPGATLDAPFAQLVVAGGLGTVVYVLIALPANGWATPRRLAASRLAVHRGTA